MAEIDRQNFGNDHRRDENVDGRAIGSRVDDDGKKGDEGHDGDDNEDDDRSHNEERRR